MACTLTTGRDLACNDAVGGIKAIYLANYIENLHANATFASGVYDGTDLAVEVFRYEVRPTTASFTTTITNAPTGSAAYDTNVEVTLHKLGQASSEELQNVIQSRFHCFVLDANDKVYWVGAINGCTATAGTAVSGVARADLNGYTLTITAGESAFPIEAAPSADPDNAAWPFDGIDAGTAVFSVSTTNIAP